MRNAVIVFLFVLAACAAPQPPAVSDGPGFKDLEPAEAQKLLDQKETSGLFVLNVHTPYEGKLDKTDAIIEDWENIAAHADQLPEDKSQPILVYCRTGRMSTSAVEQLKSMGYTNLYHLKGGMRAWDGQGLPIIDKTFE
jgi:rhodanese-related sulfurtransferase